MSRHDDWQTQGTEFEDPNIAFLSHACNVKGKLCTLKESGWFQCMKNMSDKAHSPNDNNSLHFSSISMTCTMES